MPMYETSTYDELPLVVGGFPTHTEPKTIAAGSGALTRGTVLGMVAASGKFIKSLAAAVDGSQVVRAILAEDVDATAADVVAPSYIGGTFNPDALTFGAGHNAASVSKDFVGTPMSLRKPVKV